MAICTMKGTLKTDLADFVFVTYSISYMQKDVGSDSKLSHVAQARHGLPMCRVN